MESRLIPYTATTSVGKRRVLVLAPHPDDEVFGCGAAIAMHVAEGSAVHVVIVTDGAYRTSKSALSDYAQIRRKESITAGHLLGYGTPEFWGLADRGLEYGEELVLRIESAMQDRSSDCVYAPSLHEMHPDHRALGMAALEAVRRTPGTQLVMYEVGVAMLRPNVLLDIGKWMPRKEAAMACFASQLEGQAYDRQIRALNQFRSYTLGPNVGFAEAFRVVHTHELEWGPVELYESEYQRQRSLGVPMAPADIPLVSVIVRCNCDMNRHRTLDSIALQTYPHIEVVLVPTGTGNAPSLGTACGRFPMVQVCLSEPISRANAFNRGMQAARGQYLILLDDGDTLLPNHLSRLTEALVNSPNMVAYAGVAVHREEGLPPTPLDEPWSAARLLGRNFLTCAAVLFHRSLVEKGCQFRAEFDSLADWDFWLQLAAYTHFIHLPTVSAVVHRAASPSELKAGHDVQTNERDTFVGHWLSHAQPQAWGHALAWYEDQLAQSEATIGQLHAENLRHESARPSTEHQLLDAQQLLAGAQTHCEALEQRIQHLQSEADRWRHEARAEKEHILQSTSWRVTAPLRYLVRLFKRR